MKIPAVFLLGVIVLMNAAIAPHPAFPGFANAQSKDAGDKSLEQIPETAPRLEDTADGVVLKSGTEVKLVFAQSLSSKHATIGEKVELRVGADIVVDQTVVVPAGARVIGTVVQGKKNEKYGNSKDLAVSVDYVVTRGMKIRLTGEKQQKAKTNVASATAATIGLGVSGLMIYMSQREAWIREGTPATGYVAEDVVFK